MMSRLRIWAIRVAVTGIAIVCVLVAVVLAVTWTSSGSRSVGPRQLRMEQSPQWSDGAFANKLARVDGRASKMLASVFAEVEGSVPDVLTIEARKKGAFASPPASNLRVTWLGHSTLLVEVDGRNILIDPVWGERASPVTWLGPLRFHEPPLALDDLPDLDAIVISHDHYDHLDFPTVEKLRTHDVPWIVPLGIGAHLEYWGVPLDQIVELDWWQHHDLDDVRLTCTPARHFSGRSPFLTDQNATLWAGWALTGPAHRIYYSGDTALFPELKDIGEKLGPFDLTMIEVGASDPLWTDVHLGPEQAVIAHQLVKGKLMLPVHWGTFDLGNHAWTQPIQRVLVAAAKVGVDVITPRPGASIEPTVATSPDLWWDPSVPWRTAEDRPVWSTSVEEILVTSPLYRAPLR